MRDFREVEGDGERCGRVSEATGAKREADLNVSGKHECEGEDEKARPLCNGGVWLRLGEGHLGESRIADSQRSGVVVWGSR